MWLISLNDYEAVKQAHSVCTYTPIPITHAQLGFEFEKNVMERVVEEREKEIGPTRLNAD